MVVLNWLLSKLNRRVIAPDCPDGMTGKPLLTRFFLFRSSNLGIFLHQWHRSDMDEFHDHPWSFLTILMSSGYWEHEPANQWAHHLGRRRNRSKVELVDPDPDGSFSNHVRIWRPRFSVMYHPALYQHFVEVPKPMWSLVFRFRRFREWGFITDGKWIHWKAIKTAKSRSICED